MDATPAFLYSEVKSSQTIDPVRGALTEVIAEMLQPGLVLVELGSMKGLCKKHVSSKKVLPPPVTGEAHPLAQFARIDVVKLKTMFSLSCYALVGGRVHRSW